jgi:hypothetical protein
MLLDQQVQPYPADTGRRRGGIAIKVQEECAANAAA